MLSGVLRGESLAVDARPALSTSDGSVAKFDFWAKSKNWVSGIQRLTDSQTLEKATLRQNRVQRRQRAAVSCMPTLRLQLHHTCPSTRALYGVDQRVARHGQIKVHLESRTRTKGVGSAIVRDLSARLVRHALHRCALQRRDAAFRLG